MQDNVRCSVPITPSALIGARETASAHRPLDRLRRSPGFIAEVALCVALTLCADCAPRTTTDDAASDAVAPEVSASDARAIDDADASDAGASTPDAASARDCERPANTFVDREFDRVFDVPGVPYYPNVEPDSTLALAFTADRFDHGRINIYSRSGTISTAISRCPGVVNVSADCQTGYYNRTGNPVVLSPDFSIGVCNIGLDPRATWYFNIRNRTSRTLSIQMTNNASPVR